MASLFLLVNSIPATNSWPWSEHENRCKKAGVSVMVDIILNHMVGH